MGAQPKVTTEQLIKIKNELGKAATATLIQKKLHEETGIMVDESTIRGRLVAAGQGLLSTKDTGPDVNLGQQTKTAPQPFVMKQHTVEDEFKKYIPDAAIFVGYVERPVDRRLAMHYQTGKFPVSQGKQGTGKTMGHLYYAHKANLPFALLSCHEEMKLHKLYGDKTIQNGNIVFRESEFVRLTQVPSVILFDEINAISNKNTFDFHALLQNRELFVKDADNGNGKWFKLHPECKIGFAMNPKSQKYIGGNIKPSNFLGRCTFLTYPEFSVDEIKKAVSARHPKLPKAELDKFVKYFQAITDVIDKSKLPIDVSIRQLNNLIDFEQSGMPLKEAIEDSISGMLDAVSQPAAKESFFRIAQACWDSLKK